MEDIAAGHAPRRALTTTAALMLIAVTVLSVFSPRGGPRKEPGIARRPETTTVSAPAVGVGAPPPHAEATRAAPTAAPKAIRREPLEALLASGGEKDPSGERRPEEHRPRDRELEKHGPEAKQPREPQPENEDSENGPSGKRAAEKRAELSARVVGRIDAGERGAGWVLQTEPWGRVVQVFTDDPPVAASGPDPDPVRDPGPDSDPGPDPDPGRESSARLIEEEGALWLSHGGKRYTVIDGPWERPAAAAGPSAAVSKTRDEQRRQQP